MYKNSEDENKITTVPFTQQTQITLVILPILSHDPGWFDNSNGNVKLTP